MIEIPAEDRQLLTKLTVQAQANLDLIKKIQSRGDVFTALELAQIDVAAKTGRDHLWMLCKLVEEYRP